ncbi:MAG: F0F1 ATP synthase subunit gamma, partial [Candidatus Omnitrophica bacterium]|nr:F0F1 ATP synthase subunit gamma [Candidatus Omnitrophota bacterium]
GRPYFEGLEHLLGRLLASEPAGGKIRNHPPKLPCRYHPYLEKRKGQRVALLLLTSDTGLCGSYNSELIEKAVDFIRTQEVPPLLIGVGRIGLRAFKQRGIDCPYSFTNIRMSQMDRILKDLEAVLSKIYRTQEADAIYAVYAHFFTFAAYRPAVEKILPIEDLRPDPAEAGSKASLEYIFEPSPDFIFGKLVPHFFSVKVRKIFLETLVSEQLARMTAMHQASENAEELLDTLTLLRNKARQAAITKEIIEVVSGSRALKLK